MGNLNLLIFLNIVTDIFVKIALGLQKNLRIKFHINDLTFLFMFVECLFGVIYCDFQKSEVKIILIVVRKLIKHYTTKAMSQSHRCKSFNSANFTIIMF